MNVGYNRCNLDKRATHIFLLVNFSLKMLEQGGIPEFVLLTFLLESGISHSTAWTELPRHPWNPL